MSKNDGNTNVNCQNVSIFIVFFLPYPNFAPLSPNITSARGSDTLRITWFEKSQSDPDRTCKCNSVNAVSHAQCK